MVVAGATAGAASGVAIEYVLSRGQADRDDYIVAGTVGALPGGLGARGTITLISKLSKLRHFSRKAGDTVVETALIYAHRGSPVFLGREVVGITSGLAGGYAVGQLYDHFKSRGGQQSPSMQTREAKTRKSMRGPSAQKKTTRRSRRLARRRRKYCRKHRRYDYCR